MKQDLRLAGGHTLTGNDLIGYYAPVLPLAEKHTLDCGFRNPVIAQVHDGIAPAMGA